MDKVEKIYFKQSHKVAFKEVQQISKCNQSSIDNLKKMKGVDSPAGVSSFPE